MKTRHRLLAWAPFIVLVIIFIGFPVYSYSKFGTVQPGHKIIEHTVTQPRTSNTTSSNEPEGESLTVEALSQFYDTIITILLAVLAAVAGLALLSLRIVSHAHAEDIARGAVHKIFKDSKDFHDKLSNLIRDEISDRLAELDQRLDKIESALIKQSESTPAAQVEATAEQHVVAQQIPGDH